MKEDILIVARVILLPLLIACAELYCGYLNSIREYNWAHYKQYLEGPVIRYRYIEPPVEIVEYWSQWNVPTYTGPSIEEQDQRAREAVMRGVPY